MRSLRSLNRPLLLLVLFNLLPQVHLRPLWAVISAFTIVGFRLWLDIANWRQPPRWCVWAAQVAVAAMVWRHYHSFFGDEAGGTLLTLLTCLKTFELRYKRDYFISAALCILVLMSVLLLDQSLTITLFLIVDVIAIVGFLLALEEDRWQWRKWKQILKPSAALTLKTLPLVVVLFVLFPRFNTGFGHQTDLKGKTGVSDSLKPGSISRLVGSDELMFRATFLDGTRPLRNQLYWRGAVLNYTRGLNWFRGHVTRQPMSKVVPSRPNVEIFLEPGADHYLFALENTQILHFPNESMSHKVSLLNGGIFEMNEPLQTRERYVLQVGDNVKDPFGVENFLQVDERPSPELQKFLTSFKGKGEAETVNELLYYFRKNGYSYSLTPEPVSNIDDFLFKTKTGFCEHYAGTMASLLRYLGIPARVVIGFQGGTPSFFDNYISVRATDAHAWVEYYDHTAKRWRRSDPTAALDPARVSVGSETYLEAHKDLMPAWLPGTWARQYFRLRAFADELDASWTGFLLRFDLARQKELLAKLGMEEVMIRALLVFLVLSAGLFLAVLYFFEAQKSESLSVEEKIYRQLLRKLKRKWNLQKAANEGPLTLMKRIESQSPELAPQVEPILGRLILARFGNTPLTAANAKSLRREIGKLTRA